MKFLLSLFIVSTFIMGGCSTDSDENTTNNSDKVDVSVVDTSNENEVLETTETSAKIVSVDISGEIANYTFSVGIESPDTGCDQYANWWEVITEDGTLIYRRILAHSHVNEQPFIRQGSGISVQENQVLIVRGHMNISGYGIQIFKGSISEGFTETTISNTFANDLEKEEPLPESCAF